MSSFYWVHEESTSGQTHVLVMSLSLLRRLAFGPEVGSEDVLVATPEHPPFGSFTTPHTLGLL